MMTKPSFIRRLGQAARYALSGGKALATQVNTWQNDKPTYSGGKALATQVNTWQNDKPTYSGVKFETIVKEGYRANELIFACVSKAANTAAQVQAQLVGADGEAVETHMLLDLIRRPNPFMSEFDFWTAVVTYQKLAGVAYFEKVRSGAGVVVELWPLRPDWTSPIADSKKFIGGYEYTVPGSAPVRIEPENVLRFPLFDPLNMYHGWPPAAVAGRVGDVDNNATDYLKLFFEKGGTPPGVLTSKQRLLPPQIEQLRAGWRARYGGIRNWMDPVILDSDATYQAIGSSFKDMGFDVLDARNEARICAVMGVPPILVGAKIGLDRSTYSNYAEARKAWWQDDLLPMYANFQDVIDNGLAKEWGDDLRFEWDLSGVWALKEDEGAARQQATAALASGAITVNEYREWLEMEDIGPSGDIFLRGPQTEDVPMKTIRKPAADPAPDADPDMDEEDADVKALKASRPPDEARRNKHERIVLSAMTEYFDGQMKRAVTDARNGR